MGVLLPGSEKSAKRETVQLGDLQLPVAFEIRCSAKGGRCNRVRAYAAVLPTDSEKYALLIEPARVDMVSMQFKRALVPRSFEGACSVPGCPAPGHDRYYERDAVYLAPQSGEDSAKLVSRFEGGVIKTIELCLDFQVLRPHYEECREKGRARALLWAPGKEGTLLKPEWQRIRPSFPISS
ncbi:hypothetical protein AB0F18_30270 [Streptomyces sp. NPDC029216]|uniref:hypothetical protein n=1 Tax=Streptomyces sp. NPDC029216 TaxID=3154701 RepID=UPI0033E5C621